ncbi:type VI secretion system baseplate subunit TssF [Fluviispira vulneris]|uniref:type VI secretion system baseplate subunit TssF n=1 Tax=Fluviispira vulneris TaxID=2763012 RepID=UPI0016479EFC|nr:type VI secretion system baseplate subunit TssF [Fluviispira vulneris]
MNTNQHELVRLLTLIRNESLKYSELHPNLLPALMQNSSQLNDPETERLIECFGFMLAQSGENFVNKAKERKYSDLSHFLPEWFEPVSSSTILKAQFNIKSNTKDLYIPEHTQFSLPHIKTNETLKFSNDTPCPIIPLQIEESYFALSEDHYCLNIKSCSI